jgi:hypothetical protein
LHRPFCNSFRDTLHEIANIRNRAQGLTIEKTVLILVCAAETAKYDAKIQQDHQALQQNLEKPTPAIAK